jgi:hypothetical protein
MPMGADEVNKVRAGVQPLAMAGMHRPSLLNQVPQNV